MDEASAPQITQLLQAWSAGEDKALARLMPMVYEELRRIARRRMAFERQDVSLQATALVNEVYLKLVDVTGVSFRERSQFFGLAAQLMRRILVDHARRHNLKRGAGLVHVTLDEAAVVGGNRASDLVALDDAMNALAQFDPRKVQVVEMRFFGGLSLEETAQVLKVSAITVRRDLRTARAWLYRALTGGTDHGFPALETNR